MAICLPGQVHAHVAEQGFVLLLPTGAYSAAGVAVVGLTVLALIVLPDRWVRRWAAIRQVALPRLPVLQRAVSLCGTFCFLALVWIGLTGPRDPLSNLMPLGIWTLFWIAMVSLVPIFGNFWRWINPWTGLARLIGPATPPLRLFERISHWPALFAFLAFAGFMLADPAPDDPARLAGFAALYWAVHLCGVLAFGTVWLARCEPFTLLFDLFARLAPVTGGAIGWPGWALATFRASLPAGLFALSLLAVGSFDGFNETFVWLGWVGVNPLEFPGRSALIWPTLFGLGLSILGLIAVFAACCWLGMRLAGAGLRLREALPRLALSVLPIAWGYHVAHYLTAWLVGHQYLTAALTDPFATGADFLGLGTTYVTTGFFNQIGSVRLIWLTQAGAVVLGHVWSILLAHRIACDLVPEGRAVRATLPLSLFMIAYTFLGLWLLAAPRGA